MYYLSACNRGLFKSYYCYVLLLPFKKPFKYYKKYFQFLIPPLKKKLISQQIQEIFSSRVCHFQYDHRFVFSREKGNIKIYKELRIINLLNLGC